MKNTFHYFTYLVLFVVGGMMFVVSDGHIIKICIACTSIFKLVLGVISIATSIIGVVRESAFKNNAVRQ